MKILALLIGLFFFKFSFSQFNKNDLLIGGTVGFLHSKSVTVIGNTTSSITNNSFSALPIFSYVPKENLVLSLGIGFGVSSSKETPAPTQTTKFFPTFPLYSSVKLYKTIAPNLFLGCQLLVDYGFSKSRSENNDSIVYSNYIIVEDKTNIIDAGISPLFTYFLTKRFALDLQLGSIYYRWFHQDTQYSNGAANHFSVTTSNFIFSIFGFGNGTDNLYNTNWFGSQLGVTFKLNREK